MEDYIEVIPNVFIPRADSRDSSSSVPAGFNQPPSAG